MHQHKCARCDIKFNCDYEEWMDTEIMKQQVCILCPGCHDLLKREKMLVII